MVSDLNSRSSLISVIMPVYNTEKYVSEAIESILRQCYHDFEFIIVDDASTDYSLEIIEKYRQMDNRIKVIINIENVGLGLSLQKALEITHGDFIARMDADDISTPDRFEKQLSFLEKHPEIGILGGDEWLMDDKGTITGELITPKLPGVIRWNMLLGNGIITPHPGVMMRKDFLRQLGGYGNQRTAQDFELWSRTFEHTPLPIANLDEKILYYRQHAQASTSRLKETQEESAIRTRRCTIEKLLNDTVSEDSVSAYRYFSPDFDEAGNLLKTWIKVYKAFIERFRPQKEELDFIQNEMTQRLSQYIYLNPFTAEKKGRISYLQSRQWLPREFSKRLLAHKLHSV